jgi:pimeloyl-ACP methyl ester carboxylesterase
MGASGERATTAARHGAVLVTAVLLTAACGALDVASPAAAPAPAATTAPASATPAPTPTEVLEDTLDWEPCGEGDERLECATLAVPLDHAAPGGPTLDLAVSRLPAPPAAHRLGAVVVNPGGPGGSGVDLVRHGAVDVFPAEVRTRFDIVGFDPRGVGASRAIACATRSETLVAGGFAPRDAGEWAALTEAVRAFADGCAAETGDLLAHVSTQDVVADLDLLRAALGEPQLTFLGFSYGTHIGARYAEAHPERVRAMVLDGAVDPSLDLVADVRDQARALEAAFDAFLAECAASGCPLAAGDDPAAAYDAVRAGVESGGLPAPQLGRAVSATDLHLVVTGLLRDRDLGWPWLAVALAEAVAGDGSTIAELAELMLAGGELGEHDQLAALWAVNCTDLPAPPPAAFPDLAEQLAAEAPRFGTTTLALHLPCAVWPVEAGREPAPVAASDAPRVLVVGVTGDPVTPYAWSESLATQLDARLVTRDGARHTAFGAGNVCTDRAVSRYLIDLVLPAEGWSCG